MQIERFWVKKKFQKKFLVVNFLSLGVGLLRGKKTKILKIAQNMIFLRIERFWVEKNFFPKKIFWPFFRFLSPPKSPKNENFEKMKKTTPDIFLKYQKNPQTHIFDKLASRECAPTDAKKWDRHTYIHTFWAARLNWSWEFFCWETTKLDVSTKFGSRISRIVG